MTDNESKDRLIELFRKIKYAPFPEMKAEVGFANQFSEHALNMIADEFLANGVIVPPCKVGDSVYFHHIVGTNEDSSPIEEVRAGTIYKIQFEKDNQIWLGVSFGIWYCCRPYTDFYFSKEEAERELEKRKSNGTI